MIKSTVSLYIPFLHIHSSQNCDLTGCDLEHANLRGSNLAGAILKDITAPLHMSQTVNVTTTTSSIQVPQAQPLAAAIPAGGGGDQNNTPPPIPPLVDGGGAVGDRHNLGSDASPPPQDQS